MNDFQEIWDKVLNEFNSKLTDESLKWFNDLEVYLENDKVIIASKDEFTIEWLSVRYRMLIEDTLEKFLNLKYQLNFVAKENKKDD